MWARVPTDVKATGVAIVLVGLLMGPVHSPGWGFPDLSAFSSTVNFYRGLSLAEDGRVDEAVESFRKSFGLPSGKRTTLTAKPPFEADLLLLLHRPHQALGVGWAHHREPCDSLKALNVKKPIRRTDCL